ncbi:hypothetical protein PIB30_043861 [Stylosanthes scabra]|uniref:Ubiquitin-like protease family profile domain-containing protein n=1 Tax=Stylosanthes scabra TaxID=79078 RepID=A0ABU6ZEF7_9FABA|nr:hypothetical protein [Stylosanthes scabra]
MRGGKRGRGRKKGNGATASVAGEKEIVEISSSVFESHEKNENNEEINSPQVNNIDAREKVLTNAVQQMTNAVTTLSQIIVQQTPPVFPVFTGMSPVMYPSLGTPLNKHEVPNVLFAAAAKNHEEPITNQSVTDLIMAKLDEKETKVAAPTSTEHTRTRSKNISNNLETVHGVTKNLFADFNQSQDCQKEAGNDIKVSKYINHRSPPSLRIPQRSNCSKIPQWVPMLFKPPEHMNLTEEELYMAAYIFGPDMSSEIIRKEELISTTLCVGEREVIANLISKQPVPQDVLNLLVCMLTFEAKSAETEYQTHWFLPTTFSVFIPINDDNEHWYLLIVDFYKKHLILLDSMKTPERMHNRILAVKTLGIFIERMLANASFYKFQVTYRPKVSTFPIVEPAGIGEQKKGSIDCAIWVASWMRECPWSDNYAIKQERTNEEENEKSSERDRGTYLREGGQVNGCGGTGG